MAKTRRRPTKLTPPSEHPPKMAYVAILEVVKSGSGVSPEKSKDEELPLKFKRVV